jgi:hypothetical protein
VGRFSFVLQVVIEFANRECLDGCVDFADARQRRSPVCVGVVEMCAQNEAACALMTRPPWSSRRFAFVTQDVLTFVLSNAQWQSACACRNSTLSLK